MRDIPNWTRDSRTERQAKRARAIAIAYAEYLAMPDRDGADAADGERFEQMAFGEPDGDSSGESAYNDRLSMGRNDAGEWLGFM